MENQNMEGINRWNAVTNALKIHDSSKEALNQHIFDIIQFIELNLMHEEPQALQQFHSVYLKRILMNEDVNKLCISLLEDDDSLIPWSKVLSAETIQLWNRFNSDTNTKQCIFEANRYLRDMLNLSDPKMLELNLGMSRGEGILVDFQNILKSPFKSDQFLRFIASAKSDLNNNSKGGFQSIKGPSRGLQQALVEIKDQLAECRRNPKKNDIFILQDAILQLQTLAVPLTKARLTSLYIPEINGASHSYEYHIRDLNISLPELLPKFFELKTLSDMKISIDENSPSQTGTVKVQMDLCKLKPLFKDVQFWYKRSSFPKIEDRGIVDVDLSIGKGTSVRIIWVITKEEGKKFDLALTNVDCSVHDMEIKIKSAKHKIFDNFVTGLFIDEIKQTLAQAIVDGLASVLQPLNNYMTNYLANELSDAGFSEEERRPEVESTTSQIKTCSAEEAYNEAINQIRNVKNSTNAPLAEGVENIDGRETITKENVSTIRIETHDRAVSSEVTEKSVEFLDTKEKAEYVKSEVRESKPGNPVEKVSTAETVLLNDDEYWTKRWNKNSVIMPRFHHGKNQKTFPLLYNDSEIIKRDDCKTRASSSTNYVHAK